MAGHDVIRGAVRRGDRVTLDAPAGGAQQMEGLPRHDVPVGGRSGFTVVAGIVLIDVGHRLEEEGVLRIIDFMSRNDSFANLEEAAAAIADYLPHRKEVRASSLTRNLRQRPDGRWEWKHSYGRRLRGEQG